jgi:probable F420-dependent oxidoreductase
VSPGPAGPSPLPRSGGPPTGAPGPGRYGVLLPHFGVHATRERLVAGSRRLEAYGFDSVWVRDHLVYHPHPFEDPDRTHLDPFVVLGAVAGATERLGLGTASLIPHRHPIHAALLIASLAHVAGPDRVVIGLGLGGFQHEFDAVGLGEADRRELVPEQADIFRKLWTGRPVSHQGRYYRFRDVDIHPAPARPIPLWYCGGSDAAVRRAVEFCDGWLPGLMPRRDFERRMQRLRRLAEAAGKPVPPAGMIPHVVPADTPEAAARHVDLPRLLDWTARRYRPPESGPFRTLEDLDGAVLYGPPDRIVEGVRRWQAAGCSHVVFDLRLRFTQYEECVQLLAEEVLPKLR